MNRTEQPIVSATWQNALLNITTGMAGLSLNIWILIATKKVKGNFKICTANLALADLLYAMVTMSEPLFTYVFPNYEGVFCKIEGYLIWSSIAMTTTALLPISLNRYYAIFREDLYEQYFEQSKKLTLVLCGVANLSGFGFSALIASQGELGRRKTMDSSIGMCLTYGNNTEPRRYGTTLLVVASILSLMHLWILLVNLKIHLKIRSHKSVTNKLQDKTRDKETKQLARATFIQAAVPILIQVPIIIVVLYHMVHKISGIKTSGMGFGGRTALQLLRITPITDAVIDIILIKPYRKIFILWFNNAKRGTCAMSTGDEVVPITTKKTPH